MQSQYPDVTVMETLAAKMELPVEKICVRREDYTCHARGFTGRHTWGMHAGFYLKFKVKCPR